LSQSTDHSEEPSTLPAPELNPLLNPILGQNMGKWAEVYFTSPPEKRDQAVQELLRELEAKSSPREAAVADSSPSQTNQPVVASQSFPPEGGPMPIRCPSCGRENRAAQKFCGMCGTRLGDEAAQSQEDMYSAASLVEAAGQDEAAPFRAREPEFVPPKRTSYQPASYQPASYEAAPYEPASYEPASSRNDLSLFQSGRARDYERDYEDERSDEIFSYPAASRSYRVYIGIALALIIFSLGYMAWRSAQAARQNTHVESAAPPQVAKEPATAAPVPPNATAGSTNTDTANQPAAANHPATVPARQAARQAAEPPSPAAQAPGRAVGQRTPSEKAAQLAALRTPTPEKSEAAPPSAAFGAEELATAQQYLNGSNGQPRNSAEGVKWLWRAIAKHNSAASLLLADLYLKGDGVSKNCDQARVLLDAAAIKGMKEAGTRLRNLQSFGCD
jgi:zinc-ribbon domain